MIESKFYKYIYYTYLSLLCLFVYASLDALVLHNISVYPQIVQAFSAALCFLLLFVSNKRKRNKYCSLFVWWYLAYIVLYMVTPHYDIGIVGFFRVTWFLNAFFISYICSQRILAPTKPLIIACLVLLVINAVFVYLNIFTGVSSVVLTTDDIVVSNIVFWSFCLLPICFLIEYPLLRNIAIAVISIICLFTMKRSAFIALFLILAFYIYSIKHEKGKTFKFNRKYMFLSFIVISVVLFKYGEQFLEIFNRNIDRLSSIEEDRGSNRFTVWKDVINAFDNNTTIEWIFGNGMGSTLVKARHTTAHNDFLTILFEFGLIGVTFYISFIYRMVSSTFRAWRTRSYKFMSYVSSLIILLVIGNVGDMFTCYTYLAYIMCLIGTLEGMHNNHI